MMRFLACFALMALISTRLLSVTRADEPKKLAFLVGVSEYLKDGLSNLNYADDDVEELDRVLRGLGFEVEKLVGEKARTAALRARFDQFVGRTKNELGKNDIVLVIFCGHGVQQDIRRGDKLVTEAFFCPYDAVRTDPATMISISDVMTALERDSGSSQNLLVIDACRDDPTRGRGLDGSTVERLPAKLSILFACSANQRSFESSQVKHGVFTHVLLEGLKGEGANKRGEVTWIGLAGHVTTEVPRQLPKLVIGVNEQQRPNLLGNLVLNPVLGIVRPTASPPAMLIAPFSATEGQAARSAWAKHLSQPADITNSIDMKLVLIPPGEFVMGSPPTELDDVAGAHRENESPQHRVRITKPFFLGCTEVTQKQWKAVIGTTPWKEEKVAPFFVHDGADYPVTHVTFDDATAFCQKLSLMTRSVYRLPTEAEWEYACRAGTKTKYSFGESIDHVNDYEWQGNLYPGNDKVEMGPHTVAGKLSNAWGLHDLHGNVYEFCSDRYDDRYYSQSPLDDPIGAGPVCLDRVVRSGNWALPAHSSAFRSPAAPQHRNLDLGFRVVLVP